MASRRSHAPTNTSRLSMSCGFLSPASRNQERVRWRLFHSCAPSELAVGFWWIRVLSGHGVYKVAYYTAPAMVGCGATARRHSLLCLYCCLFRDKGDIKTKKESLKWVTLFLVVPPGIEPGTQGFSVLCSTIWAMAPTVKEAWFLLSECKGSTIISFCQIFRQLFSNNFFSVIFLLKHYCMSKKTCTFALAFET